MKSSKLFLCCSAAVLAVAVFTSIVTAQAPDLSRMDFVLRSVPNGPVALVNGEPIDPEAYRDFYVGELVQWDKANPDKTVTDRVRIAIALRVLQQLIQQEIMVQEANRRGVTISATELNEAWDREFAKIKQSIPAAERETLSDEQILQKLGATRDEARKDLLRVLLIDKMRDTIIDEAGITVSDAEVKEWYAANEQLTMRPETIHVKQMFFKNEPGAVGITNEAENEAKKNADKALLLIKSGQSFDKVARNMSQGQFKDQGGDWGPRPADQLPPFVVETARKLNPGEISGVIQSEFGYHIIQLIEVTAAGKVSFAQAEPEIRRMLLRERGNVAVQRYCAAIMADEEKVRVYLDLESQIKLRPHLLELYQDEMKNQKAGGR